MAGELEELGKKAKKLRDQAAEIIRPGFSYAEQELIHRVFKSVLPQLKSKTDRGIANDILSKTEWLEEHDGNSRS